TSSGRPASAACFSASARRGNKLACGFHNDQRRWYPKRTSCLLWARGVGPLGGQEQPRAAGQRALFSRHANGGRCSDSWPVLVRAKATRGVSNRTLEVRSRAAGSLGQAEQYLAQRT